jgi:acyl-CoA synthetase (AMP-forming)/AMP-acid ligase II
VTDDLITHWLYEPNADTGLHFLEDDGSWRRVPYDKLAARVWGMAAVLDDRGLAGQRLGLVGATGEDFLVQAYATIVTGGTCVPVPHPLPGQDNAAHDRKVRRILTDSQPAAVLEADLPAPPGEWRTVSVPAYGAIPVKDPEPLRASSAPAAIQFTSGTSGPPKGVRLGRRALSASVRACREVMGISPHDRLASWLPWWHIGNILPSPAGGNDLFLISPLQFFNNPETWMRCFGQLGCTMTSSPSFGYMHVLNSVTREALADCRFDGWRLAVVATEPPRAGDLDAFVDTFGPLGFKREALSPTYGLTETTLVATITPPGRPPVVRPGDEGPSALVGSGRAVPGCRVAIRLVDGSEAPEGTTGEIFVGGENLADGYEPGDDFGEWVATGDAGCMYGGELFVLGRISDSFQIRGERHYAPDVEAQIQARTPDALAVAVVPSRAAGVGITVVVESAEDWPPPRPDEEAEAVSAMFGGIDVDLLVVTPGGIPRTSAGKPQRRECFQRYVGSGLAAERLPSR